MAISASEACATQNEYSQLMFSSNGQLGWVERSERTSYVPQVWTETAGVQQRLSPPEYAVLSRVHEYGGRAWCWGKNAIYFVESRSQQLFSLCLETLECRQLTQCINSRFMEPLWQDRFDTILAIEEQHGNDHVINRVVSVNRLTGEVTVLHDECDFYAGLTLHPNQLELAFVAWNLGEMPWSQTHFCIGRCNDRGQWVIEEFIDRVPQSIAMASYDRNGVLHLVSDKSGFWTIHRYSSNHRSLTPVTHDASDQISSPWQSGMVQYCFTETNQLLHLRFTQASVELVVNGSRVEIEGINHFREIVHYAGRTVLIAAGMNKSLHLLELSQNGETTELTDSQPTITSSPVLPRMIQFEVDGTPVSGFYYAPQHPAEAPAPLLMLMHGGPTSATYPVYNSLIQFWCSNGFAVFDLNYRGSSNSGRAYRYALHKQWGVAEVQDVHAAADHLVELGLAMQDRLFIRGRSSGGYSALLAARENRRFRALTSYFGVTNPKTLRQSTHKFESRYLDWLLPDDAQRISADTLCKGIASPVLFLQGMQDVIVTPDQTRDFQEQLLSRGVHSEVVYFPDEGHGFRKRENQARSLEVELDFYLRTLTGNQ